MFYIVSMEYESKFGKIKLSQEEALHQAKADSESWERYKFLALESYLTTRAKDQLDPLEYERLWQDRVRTLEPYNIDGLLKLGEEYHITPDFDLESAALQTYCRVSNIELSS